MANYLRERRGVHSAVVFRQICCMSTRAATLGAGAFDMLSSVVTLIIMITVMKAVGDYVALMLNIGLWSVMMWMIVRSVLGLVTSLVLIIGVVKERRMLMLPWLLTSFASVFAGVGTAIVAPLGIVALDAQSQGESGGFGPLVPVVMCIMLSFGVVGAVMTFLIPFSHYMLLAERERSSDYSEDGCNNGACKCNGNHGVDPSSIPLKDIHDNDV